MEKWQAENLHYIAGKQVRRIVTFWRGSKKLAKEKFHLLHKADPTIQEAVLKRVKDGSVAGEYCGYI